jgi:hypothetical protein
MNMKRFRAVTSPIAIAGLSALMPMAEAQSTTVGLLASNVGSLSDTLFGDVDCSALLEMDRQPPRTPGPSS